METCHVQINKVMAAIDLSHYSESVFSFAATLSKANDAEIVVLHIIDSRGLDYFNEMHVQGLPITKEQHIANLKEKQSDIIQKEYLRLYGSGPVRMIIKIGDPAKEIIKTVNKEDPSMVILGPRGSSAVEGFFFGSVAEKVFRHCPCPVLSIRGPEHCQISDFD